MSNQTITQADVENQFQELVKVQIRHFVFLDQLQDDYILLISSDIAEAYPFFDYEGILVVHDASLKNSTIQLMKSSEYVT